MAKVHVCNVVVLDNPSQFNNPFQFEITFECIEDLPEDLEWKIIYVGSAESEEFDQVCDRNYYCMKCELNNLGLGYCLCRPRSRGTAHVRVPGNFLQFDSKTLFLSVYLLKMSFLSGKPAKPREDSRGRPGGGHCGPPHLQLQISG